MEIPLFDPGFEEEPLGVPPSARRGASTEPLDDAASLQHDLRTPLNQIAGYAHLLEVELRDLVDPHQIEDLRNIQRAARKLLAMAHVIEGGAPSLSPLSVRPPPPAAPELEPADEALGSILVVDDNQVNRDILARMFRLHGYQVATAEDGMRALDLVFGGPFDAVVLDVTMPGMSGLEVLRVIRETYPASDLPVIMATARGGSADVVEMLRGGANDYVSKPLDFELVLARLETQLALKRAKERVEALASELAVRNRFIQKTFGRYLSDEVVARLLDTPEALRLGGEPRCVTILMSDLRGFTTLTEGMPPESVMRLLNGYLGEMARIVTSRGGTIVEFVGDAVLALFEAPSSSGEGARRAIACALEMQRAMGAVNAENARDGLPELEMGIALNTGEVVVGNIGSEARTKYGVVGGEVNMTARIESFTVGGQILVSDHTRRLAGPGLEIAASHELEVKGFHDRILVHELTGLGWPEGLRLPERRVEHRPLAQPLHAECASLTGKHVDGEVLAVAITAISTRGGVVRARPRPALFVDLRVRLVGEHEGRLGADLYAKVVEIDQQLDDTFEVRFTSSPSGLPALVRELVTCEG